jgi:class 3 adenylate cyclase
MKFNPQKANVTKTSNRHVFSRFRVHIRIWASIVFLAFGIFDYLYSPENALKWFGIRVATVVAAQILFFAVVKSKGLRRKMGSVAVLTIAMFCWPICYMILDSGGHASHYATGLILCGITGVQIFRLRNTSALIAMGLSYTPAIFTFFWTAPVSEIRLAFIQSGFLVGMVILSYIYGSSEEQVDRWWEKFKVVAQSEISRLQKTEILKNHFPKVIRDAFEKNPDLIFRRKILPNAVVGFADIVASSQLSNVLPLAIDWEIKEKFLEAATRRAMESEMVVLTHLGDGFLFLANYNEGSQWYYNLISFYEGLISDFRKLTKELNLDATGIGTGIKFGVSSGPVMVGFLGSNQSYFTAIGPDVNLAARLCSLAGADEIVLSSRVWHSIRPLIVGWSFQNRKYEDIKGFEFSISAVHISPRHSKGNDMVCAQCSQSMSLIKTEDGFLDYRCASGHNTPALYREPESTTLPLIKDIKLQAG